MQGYFTVCKKGAVVCKEKLSGDHLLKSFGLGHESAEVKDTSIRSEPYLNPLCEILFCFSEHPCLTPLTIGKGTERSPLCLTCPIWPTWNCCSMFRNLRGQPNLAKIVQSPSRLTVSKDLVRSMNAAWSSMFCSLHFSWILAQDEDYVCSIVPQLALNPH